MYKKSRPFVNRESVYNNWQDIWYYFTYIWDTFQEFHLKKNAQLKIHGLNWWSQIYCEFLGNIIDTFCNPFVMPKISSPTPKKSLVCSNCVRLSVVLLQLTTSTDKPGYRYRLEKLVFCSASTLKIMISFRSCTDWLARCWDRGPTPVYRPVSTFIPRYRCAILKTVQRSVTVAMRFFLAIDHT